MSDQPSHRELVARLGLRLPAVMLKRLQSAGIFCQPAVSIEYLRHAHSYILRAVESGGAIAELGAYCGFVDAGGNPLAWCERVDGLGVNGFHAMIMAPALIRLQMVRNRLAYDLLITRHSLSSVAQNRRPQLQSSILFHGHGSLMAVSNDAEPPIRPWLFFCGHYAETSAVPTQFREGVQQLVAAVWCVGCQHCHLSRPRKKNVSETSVSGA